MSEECYNIRNYHSEHVTAAEPLKQLQRYDCKLYFSAFLSNCNVFYFSDFLPAIIITQDAIPSAMFPR